MSDGPVPRSFEARVEDPNCFGKSLRRSSAVLTQTALVEEDLSRHHAYLNARRWAAVRRYVFKRDGWDQQVQQKYHTLRGLFGGRASGGHR